MAKRPDFRRLLLDTFQHPGLEETDRVARINSLTSLACAAYGLAAGLDGHPPRPLPEVAEIMRLTPFTVEQLNKEAMEKLGMLTGEVMT